MVLVIGMESGMTCKLYLLKFNFMYIMYFAYFINYNCLYELVFVILF